MIALGGRCYMIFNTVVDGKIGSHKLDRNKTPSDYNMIYDETVYLVGVVPSDLTPPFWFDSFDRVMFNIY